MGGTVERVAKTGNGSPLHLFAEDEAAVFFGEFIKAGGIPIILAEQEPPTDGWEPYITEVLRDTFKQFDEPEPAEVDAPEESKSKGKGKKSFPFKGKGFGKPFYGKDKGK